MLESVLLGQRATLLAPSPVGAKTERRRPSIPARTATEQNSNENTAQRPRRALSPSFGCKRAKEGRTPGTNGAARQNTHESTRTRDKNVRSSEEFLS